MYLQHQIHKDTKPYINLKLNEVYVNLVNKGIYTKTLNSVTTRVGNSIRTLVEAPEYTPGVNTSDEAFAILQFKVIDKLLKLTTVYPYILLINLEGTSINEFTLESSNYIGLDGSVVVNKDEPSFTVNQLGDVSNLTLSPNTNNYTLAIATSSSGGISFNKDYFVSKYYYYWTLRPEHTKLLLCDDVLTINPIATNYILRSNKLSENKGKPLETHPLAIKYDLQPKLSNILEADGHSVFNQTYTLSIYSTDKSIDTVSINPAASTIHIVDCQDITVLLNIDLNVDTAIEDLISFALIVKNFTGAINLPMYTQYENGIGLNLTGSEHIINCLFYNKHNNKKLIILQKATNLNKVPL